mgnify:CR=1 FL=1
MAENYNVGTVEVQVKTAADNAIASLDKLIAKIDAVQKSVEKTVSVPAFSNITKFAKGLNNIEKTVKKTAESTKSATRFFGLGSLSMMLNYGRRIASTFTRIASLGINFIETANLFQVSMGEMYYQALRFNNELARAFGLSQAQLMRFQATFNNMLTALPGLSREIAYQLSEVLTKSAIDYAALFNVSIERAMLAYQAVLSGQVRPIRSVSGFDVTEITTYTKYLELGGQKTMRQLNQLEKRLLRIIVLQEQMYNVDAVANYALTIEQPAQQLKVLTSQLEETGRWIATVFMDTLGDVLPYINGFVITIKELIKSLAYFRGYRLEIIREEKDPLSEITEGAENATEALDEVQKRLFSFDKFEALKKPKDELFGIDPRILDALQEYDNYMGKIEMRANKISKSIMSWLGFIPVDELDEAGEKTGGIVWQLQNGETKLKEIFDTIKKIGIVAAFIFKGPFAGIISILIDAYVTNEKIRESINRLLPQLLSLSDQALKSISQTLDALMPVLEKVINDILIPLINLLADIIRKLNEAGMTQQFIIGILAGIAFVAVVKFIEKIKKFAKALSEMNYTLAATTAMIALLAFHISNLITNWDKMSDIERVVGVLGAIAAAATIAAIAIAGLQSAWTLGLGAVAIVAGIASIVMAIQRANREAQEQAKAMQNIAGYASGGFPRQGELFIAREDGPELVGSIGGRSAVANNDQIVEGIERGVYKAMVAALSDNRGIMNLTIDFRNADDSALARLLAKPLRQEFARQGVKVGG